MIKRLQDIMRQDAGINGDAQRIEQIVWMLFLKLYDAKEEEWEIEEDNYKSIIPEEYRWRNWAIDNKDGKIYQFKVFKAKFLPRDNQTSQCGIFKIQDKETITVTCQNGLVQLFDLQLSGKKRMPAKELIKGLKLTSEVLEIKK
jgi:methionyl-tRNA formyltransferase